MQKSRNQEIKYQQNKNPARPNVNLENRLLGKDKKTMASFVHMHIN